MVSFVRSIPLRYGRLCSIAAPYHGRMGRPWESHLDDFISMIKFGASLARWMGKSRPHARMKTTTSSAADHDIALFLVPLTMNHGIYISSSTGSHLQEPDQSTNVVKQDLEDVEDCGDGEDGEDGEGGDGTFTLPPSRLPRCVTV